MEDRVIISRDAFGWWRWRRDDSKLPIPSRLAEGGYGCTSQIDALNAAEAVNKQPYILVIEGGVEVHTSTNPTFSPCGMLPEADVEIHEADEDTP